MKKIEDIDYKSINVSGSLYLVESNESNGFNFPYTLFIPSNIDSSTILIVEGANANKSSNTIKEGVEDVIEACMNRKIIDFNNETNFPILTPCFPRIYDEELGGIYTHMLTSKSLEYNKYGLKRIDLQLMSMIDDCKSKLKELGCIVDEKIIIDGFSASAKFANRFSILHPEIVRLIISGACSGTGILPLKEINGEKLLYPIGCGNVDEITNEKIEEFKKIKQFYYMGLQDINDPLYQEDKIYDSPFLKPEETEQLYKFIGKKMIPDRWEKFQLIYNQEGVNAFFESYKEFGHNPTPANDKVKQLLKEEKEKLKSRSI